MEKANFERYLKTRGKKPHVIEGLVRKAELFEKAIKKSGKTIESSSESDIKNIIEDFERNKTGDGKKIARGVALYYKAIGKTKLASVASSIREGEIAKVRKPFPLKKFPGVNPEHIDLLNRAGINNIEQMVAVARTSRDRKQLASETGITEKEILKIARLSDLARMFAIKGVRALLYYQSGYETVEKLATADPVKLREYLIDFIKATGFEGIGPLPKELESTISSAKGFKSIVQ